MNAIQRLRLRDDYRAVFDSPRGKKVLRHICAVGFVTRSTMVAGGSDLTAYNEGMRNLALSILKFVYKDDQVAEHVEEIMSEEGQRDALA